MAINQVEWKQELNKESGKWWLFALALGILQGLLVCKCLPLAGNVFGISEIKGSMKFYAPAMLISVLQCLIYGWWEQRQKQGATKVRKGRRLFAFLGMMGLLAGFGVVLWMLYGAGNGDWGSGWQLLKDTYLFRLDSQVREYELRYRNEVLLQPVLEFLLLAWFTLVGTIGGKLGKQKVILIVPVSVVCAGLLVLAVPAWNDLAPVFLCSVLIIYLENSGRILWKRLVTLCAILVFLVVVAGHYNEDAEEKMLAMNEDWFQYWGEVGVSLGEKIMNFDFFSSVSDVKEIDNKAPEYDDVPVITLETDGKPTGTIYLRGNYYTDYEDSTWEMNEESFAEACEEYGVEEEEAAEKLLKHQYKQEKKLYNSPVTYEITYTRNCDSYVYLPYAAELDNIPQNYDFSGDSVLIRGKRESEITVAGWKKLSILEGNGVVENDYSHFQEWYSDFVYENYLTVADEQEEVERLAKKLKESELPEGYGSYLKPGNYSPDIVNYYRLQVANDVADYLKKHGTYNLEPDELPKGDDVIEFFLDNGMEGFCEHFASAGTLILRELGVPARYVTGYVVWQSDFSQVAGEYEATVLDSAAHAWTEIYLENYGWVPIEMTPGYDSANGMPQTTEPPEDDTTEPTPEPTTPPEEEPTEMPQEPEVTEAPEDDEEATGDDEDSLNEEDSEDRREESNRDGSAAGMIFLVIFGLLFAIGIGFVFRSYLSKRKGHGMKRLSGYMRKDESRNAIQWINKLMYERTVEKKNRKLKYSDAEYLTVLKKTYPQIDEAQWDAYFALVRKAVYSKEHLTAEEAKFCYDVYKTVILNGNK